MRCKHWRMRACAAAFLAGGWAAGLAAPAAGQEFAEVLEGAPSYAPAGDPFAETSQDASNAEPAAFRSPFDMLPRPGGGSWLPRLGVRADEPAAPAERRGPSWLRRGAAPPAADQTPEERAAWGSRLSGWWRPLSAPDPAEMPPPDDLTPERKIPVVEAPGSWPRGMGTPTPEGLGEPAEPRIGAGLPRGPVRRSPPAEGELDLQIDAPGVIPEPAEPGGEPPAAPRPSLRERLRAWSR